MAYADTLGALNAALQPDPAPVPAATPAPARTGGYGDTLSALSSALGRDAPAAQPRAAGLDTPIPGAAPTLPATMGAMPPLTVHPSRAAPLASTTDDAIDTVEGTGERNYATGPAEGGSAMDKIRAAPGAVNDMVRAAANAVPIVGAFADRLDAGTAAALGGDYDASLKQQQENDAGFAARNPVAAGAAGFAGGAGGSVAMLPDAALGMVGNVGQRIAGAAVGGSALNAGDAAVRGENVPLAAAEGAAAGAAGPVLEGGAKLAAKGVQAVGKTLSPIIAGLQLRGAAPGDVDALLNNARTAQAAASKLRGMSSDPATLDIRLGQAPSADASGAAQTTSSAVGGDMGLYQAEKAARTVDNGPFNAGDSARSAATVGGIQAQAPTGNVFAPGQMIRSRLDALEKQAADAEAGLTAQHQDAVTGRAMATDAYAGQQTAALADRTAARTSDAQGFAQDQQAELADRTSDRNQQRFDAGVQAQNDRQAATDALAASQAGQRDAALGQAQGAAQAIGPTADVNALGSDFRAAQTDASGASKDAYGKLYKAIDPDGTLTTVVTPLKQAKQSIAAAIDPYTGVQPTGPEAALWSTIDRLPDVVPFASLQNLDARTTAAMKAVRLNPSDHDPQAISRLTQLKGAIKDNIASAGQAQADHEAGLVAAGQMDPADTLEARLGRDADGVEPAPFTTETGRATGTSDAGPATARSPGDSGAPGTQVSGGGGPGSPAGSASLQADAGRPSAQAPAGVAPAPSRPADAQSPFDRHVSPEVAKSLGTGIGRGTTQEAADGDTYLLHRVDRDASGQHTTRWVNLGPEQSLSDTIGALRSIAQVRDDTPLGIASKSMADIYRRMGVGDTPTFNVAPENYEKLTFTGRMSDGVHSGQSGRIFLQDIGDPTQQLKTAVHEGAHAAFNDVAKNDPEVAANVKALQDHANARAFEGLRRQFGDQGKSVSYGTGFRGEFLTEAFSNPHLQEYLSKIPAPPELVKRLGIGSSSATPLRTAWDAFKATIAKAFGLAPTPESMSMLEATIGYGDRLSTRAMERRGAPGEGQAFSMKGGDGPDQSRFDAPGFDPDGGPGRAPQRPDVPRPQNLADFVRSKGGMRDPGGDLAAMGHQRLIAKAGAGLSPDAMREAAAEAGYLGADTARAMRETHSNDLLNALENGDRTYSVHDYDAVHAWDQHDQAREAYDQAKGGDPAARSAGPRPKAPLSSYSNDDIYAPGTQPAPKAANGPLDLAPNWDGAAIGRKQAADAAYAEHAQTFKNGIVAPSFKTNGFAGQFEMPPAGILAKAFHPGPTGGAHLDAYLASAGNDPRALDAVEQFALNGLRAKIGPLGTLKQADVDRWLTANGPAVQALDRVKPGFLDSVRTAADADRTLADMGQAHKVEMQAHNAEAARQAYLDNEARRVGTGQANYQDKTATQALIRERQANAAAANTDDAQQTRGVLQERRSDDAAQDAASLAQTRAGIGQARDIVKTAQATPAGRYDRVAGNAVSTTEVENAVGGYLKTGTAGATRMRDLVQSVKSNPDGLQGLQKAGVDWMARNFVSDSTGMVVPHKLISFVKENGDTLKELYGHEQTSMFGALARATEANIKWRTETAVKDGSDTAKKIIAYMKGGAASKAVEHLSLMSVATTAVVEGFEHGGIQGALLGAGGGTLAYLANGLRSLGVRSADDLTRAALADVNVAKLLVGKAPTDANPERAHALLGAMRRSLVLAPAVAMAARQKNRQP